MPESPPGVPWRLIHDEPAAGARNMAIDEVLMESVRAGAPPVLRFYDWEPDCLSIGYFQSIAEVDTQGYRRRGIEIVRRPTGGNAILHRDCLTYSVLLPAASPLVRGGIVASYRRLSRPFALALTELGAPVAAAPDSARPGAGLDCFAAPGPSELTLAGRKILGSAQTRRRGVVLQHGSLILKGVPDLATFTATGTDGVTPDSAPTLRDYLPDNPDSLLSSVARHAAAAWSANFQEDNLTPAENELAAALTRDKYATPRWTAIR